MVSVAAQLRQRAQALLHRIPSAVSAPTICIAFSVPLTFPLPRSGPSRGRVALRPAPALATLQLSVTGVAWPPQASGSRLAPPPRLPARPPRPGARPRNVLTLVRSTALPGRFAMPTTAASLLPRRFRPAGAAPGERRLAPGRQRLPEHTPRAASRGRLAGAGGSRLAEAIARYRASLATWILA